VPNPGDQHQREHQRDGSEPLVGERSHITAISFIGGKIATLQAGSPVIAC
jgi:hypothetical protein